MARTTQGNIIRKNSPILSINVSPLNNSRFITFFPTLFALNGFAKISSQPIMQSTIRSSFSFPSVVFYSFSVSYFEMFFSCQSRFYTSLFNLFVSNFRITSSTTKSTFRNMRWGIINEFSAFVAIY